MLDGSNQTTAFRTIPIARSEGRVVLGNGGTDLANVQEPLDSNLEDHQDAEDFVADALLVWVDFLREDVAQTPDALCEMVVAACEVEGDYAEGVYWGDGCEGVEMFEDILLET
jgi:hypothetical protein